MTMVSYEICFEVYCYHSISDNKLILFTGVVVGFEELSYSVDESVGQFRVCVVVTMPPQSDVLNRTFSLSVSTSLGTAGIYSFTINMKITHCSLKERQSYLLI